MTRQESVSLIRKWLDDHPTVRDAVGWDDLQPETDRTVIDTPRGTLSVYRYSASVLLDGVPQCPIWLYLYFAIDSANILAVSIAAHDRWREKACSLSLTRDGDIQAGRKLDIVINNLTRFKWKEPTKYELHAPD